MARLWRTVDVNMEEKWKAMKGAKENQWKRAFANFLVTDTHETWHTQIVV